MNKTQLKNILIKTHPNCPKCGTKLVVTVGNEKFGHISHAAIIKGNELICFQCHRIAVKHREIENLPTLIRWKKKLDLYTGIPTFLRSIRIQWNQFIYFKIGGKIPRGRKPKWL